MGLETHTGDDHVSDFRGAYGFRIEGPEGVDDLLGPVPDEWPTMTITQQVGENTSPPTVIDEETATIGLVPAGSIRCVRAGCTTEYRLREALDPDALVHPYLAPAAAVHAAWIGRQSYHAAGILIDDAVWGVAGEREAGKSTLVAHLAVTGTPVLCDDLLVIDGTDALMGPRTVDLREGAADRLGATRHLGVTGMRDRWRLDLGPAPVRAPFAGWIYPQWADDIVVSTPTLEERLSEPARHRAQGVVRPSPDHAMWMAKLPAIRFERPQRWDAMDEASRALLEAVRR